MSASESRKIDYLVEINGLSVLLEETSLARSRMRDLVSRLRDLELSDPSLSKLGAESEGLRRALQEAKAAIEVHGPGSADADAAWKNLEGCAEEHGGGECNADDSPGNDGYGAAALKAHHCYDAVVDPELLSESIDALDSVEGVEQIREGGEESSEQVVGFIFLALAMAAGSLQGGICGRRQETERERA
uniref:Uncharacterized protein n=2 Tax=Odontella aurita TaxID=265563 RepID=A0A7S4MSE7_9STRA